MNVCAHCYRVLSMRRIKPGKGFICRCRRRRRKTTVDPFHTALDEYGQVVTRRG